MTAFARMPVLVVDDHKDAGWLIRKVLCNMGFENVEVVTDGETALQRLAKTSFGLAIVDWHMAPMSGIDLLARVRADDRVKGLPVLLVTGDDDTQKASAAREAGANGYLLK